ncbi:MAG: flagellar motor switch phosphatase FliY [Lachnospiraceae bacterium]|nr:flagellar motor switch phosphatase FliY [Lachnospiraceae bacterium]
MDGGMLSQDEINALLSGMDISGGGDAAPEGDAPAGDAPAPETADAGGDGGILTSDTPAGDIDESLLSMEERDAVGEIANISMGSSATTLYSLVNRKVNITTPTVELANWSTVIQDYQRPCVFIQIKYTVGLDGSNIMVLKEHDVKVITDLMMGGDGTNTDGELGELHLSAISEAMNQMMGSAATSLSTMLGKMIDISPPEASLVDLTETMDAASVAPFLAGTFAKVSFRMQIDELVDSTIIQLYPIDFAKELFAAFSSGGEEAAAPESAPAPEAPAPAPGPEPYAPPTAPPPAQAAPQMGMPQMQMPQMGYPPYGYPQMPPPNMNIQPAQFQSFQPDYSQVPGAENIGIIKDVPLEVTVELGRTKKSISEILDFAPGTIIELDKIAGEPIDVLVNGKFVAKGEVVVIEESFGIRVTEIIN